MSCRSKKERPILAGLQESSWNPDDETHPKETRRKSMKQFAQQDCRNLRNGELPWSLSGSPAYTRGVGVEREVLVRLILAISPYVPLALFATTLVVVLMRFKRHSWPLGTVSAAVERLDPYIRLSSCMLNIFWVA